MIDIVISALIGFLCGLAVVFVDEKIELPKWMEWTIVIVLTWVFVVHLGIFAVIFLFVGIVLGVLLYRSFD